MALRQDRGREGEALACDFLERRGFTVLFRNWRHKRYEIDIIASRDNVIHFIEVKTRHSVAYGLPEQAVTRKKFAHLKKGAACFLFFHPCSWRIQFDVLAVVRLKPHSDEITFLEDVYL